MIGHFIPHPRTSYPEGHLTRFAALQSEIPELELIDDLRVLAVSWDLVFVDTLPVDVLRRAEPVLRVLHYRGTRLVLIARALNERYLRPDIFDLVLVPGPYEGEAGRVVAPLVLLGPEAPRDIDTLLVPSKGQDNFWWRPIARRTGVAVAGPIARDEISRARVVIGQGGTGVLYETLWSGGRLVCLPSSREQRNRAEAARQAGEAIVVAGGLGQIDRAVQAVLQMEPLGRRPTGVDEAVALAFDTMKPRIWTFALHSGPDGPDVRQPRLPFFVPR